MRYLKYFENYNDNDFYQKVSLGNLFKRSDDGPVLTKFKEFTQNEIEILNKYLGNPKGNDEGKMWFYSPYGPFIEFIGKDEDEWFYVTVDTNIPNIVNGIVVQGSSFKEYYKCDQFDGLISLIKKIKKLPKKIGTARCPEVFKDTD